jgi:hypothetical protein
VLQSEKAVERDFLHGRHVMILPRSCASDGEKQVITDLVKRLGGTVTAGIKPARKTDLVIAGRADRKRYASSLNSHIRQWGNEYDVLMVDWLEGALYPAHVGSPQPAHYVHLSARTQEALMEREDLDAYVSASP